MITSLGEGAGLVMLGLFYLDYDHLTRRRSWSSIMIISFGEGAGLVMLGLFYLAL